MTSVLIITPESNSLKEAQAASLLDDINKPHADLLCLISDKQIGIEQIRKLNQFAQSPPYIKNTKTIIIPAAHTITIIAQNALLKTLEEKPAHTQIILSSPKVDLLLPTIISRCQIIYKPIKSTSDEFKFNFEQLLKNLSTQEPHDLITSASEYSSNRELAKDFLNQITLFLRQKLISSPSLNLAFNLNLVNDSLLKVEANTNPKLTIENLFLNWKAV